MTIDKNHDKMKTKNNIWGENVKKLKCKSCLNIWYVDDYRLNEQNYCPYCCSKIKGETKLGDIDTPSKAIYDSIRQYGIDILKDPSSLINYLGDMCPDMKKEIRLLSRALKDYRNEIFEMFNAGLSEADNLLGNLKYQLINYDEMSENGANIICKHLNDAVMLYKGKNLPVAMSVEVSDVSDISEEKQTVTKQTTKKAYLLSDIVDRGKCGNNATWTFLKDGTLVILGSGKMYDYENEPHYQRTPIFTYGNKKVLTSPLYARNEHISCVDIEQGITTIGKFAFKQCTSLTSITLPQGLQTIGAEAFYGCKSLTNITLPEGLQTIGRWAFCGCESLKEIKIPLKVMKCMSNWSKNWKDFCDAEIVSI